MMKSDIDVEQHANVNDAKIPSVSLCLIAKDEEESLPDCLASVRHLVAEMIVVDTGSQDGTAQAAFKSGARVLPFAWSGDFSSARNFALSQVNSDWILILDADERLEPVDPETFSRLLANDKVEGYYLEIKNHLAPGQSSWDKVVRLFRNKPCYRFRGAIHEQVAASILEYSGSESLASAPLFIQHAGYTQEKIESQHKPERNMAILKQELEHNPDDPFLLYCLGLEYYQQNQVEQGLTCLEQALVQMPGGEGYLEDVILYLALGYLALGKSEKLEDFIAKCLLMFPEHPDLLGIRGFCRSQGDKRQEAFSDWQISLTQRLSRMPLD